MSNFDKAVSAMKRLQRSYTTIRLGNQMTGQQLEAVKILRDLVEELVVAAYGPPPGPFLPGVLYDSGMVPGQVYEVVPPVGWTPEAWEAKKAEVREAHEASARAGRVLHEGPYIDTLAAGAPQFHVPKGFIMIDEAQLRSEMMASVFDEKTNQIIGLRIRHMFKKTT